MSNIVQRTNKRRSEIANNYQYFKEREDGWVFSVVCNRGTQGQEEGFFEIAVWNDRQNYLRAIVIDTYLNFSDVAKIEKQFDINPKRLADRHDVALDFNDSKRHGT